MSDNFDANFFRKKAKTYTRFLNKVCISLYCASNGVKIILSWVPKFEIIFGLGAIFLILGFIPKK
jgi:hypothetical protein